MTSRKCGASNLWAGFLLAGAKGGDSLCKTIGGGNEKMAGPDCRIANLDLQERIDGGLASLPAHRLSYDWLQGRVEQALYD